MSNSSRSLRERAFEMNSKPVMTVRWSLKASGELATAASRERNFSCSGRAHTKSGTGDVRSTKEKGDVASDDSEEGLRESGGVRLKIEEGDVQLEDSDAGLSDVGDSDSELWRGVVGDSVALDFEGVDSGVSQIHSQSSRGGRAPGENG